MQVINIMKKVSFWHPTSYALAINRNERVELEQAGYRVVLSDSVESVNR